MTAPDCLHCASDILPGMFAGMLRSLKMLWNYPGPWHVRLSLLIRKALLQISVYLF